MTAQHFEVVTDELPILTPKDLRHFDHEAVGLVLEYQSHGWTGWLSANMHAIMRAPDGDGTASISRKYRRKRSAEIMRRPLDQWLKRKQQEREARERTDAFGRPPGMDSVKLESPDPPWQIATKQSYDARLRMQKITRDWWKGVQEAGSGKTVWLLHEEDSDNWVLICGSREDQMSRVAAIGPEADPQLVEHFTALIEANNRKGKDPMENTGPLVKAHPCLAPECGRSFDSVGALNLHKQIHIRGEMPCPLCPKVVHTPAAFGRHIRSAIHAFEPRLPEILAALGMDPVRDKPVKEQKVIEKPSGPKGLGAVRACEYGCGVEMPGVSLGGHHRAHQKAGHVKVADGGDGATQVLKSGAKAITAPKAPEAVTEAPVKPEPLAVAAVPASAEAFAVNGTGHHETADDTLNLIRTLVNPELVGENERLRARCERAEAELETLRERCDNLQAFKDMIREATTA